MCKVLCGSLRCQLRTTHRTNQPNETFLDDPVSGGCWEFNLPAPLKDPELSRPGGPTCRSPALWTSDSYHNGFSGGTWTHRSPRTDTQEWWWLLGGEEYLTQSVSAPSHLWQLPHSSPLLARLPWPGSGLVFEVHIIVTFSLPTHVPHYSPSPTTPLLISVPSLRLLPTARTNP